MAGVFFDGHYGSKGGLLPGLMMLLFAVLPAAAMSPAGAPADVAAAAADFWSDLDQRDAAGAAYEAPQEVEELRRASARTLFEAVTASALPGAALALDALKRLAASRLGGWLRALPGRALAAVLPDKGGTKRVPMTGASSSFAPVPLLLALVCLARRSLESFHAPLVLRC